MEEFILPDLNQEKNEKNFESLIKGGEIRLDMGEIIVKSEILENEQDLTSFRTEFGNDDMMPFNYNVEKSLGKDINVDDAVDIRRPFRCPYCTKSFMKSNILKKHILHHTPGFSKTGDHVCEVCYESYPTMEKLADHELKTHRPKSKPANESPTTTCSVCGAAFSFPFLLEQHVRRSHTHEKPFQCEKCPKRFYVKQALKNHQLGHRVTPNLCRPDVQRPICSNQNQNIKFMPTYSGIKGGGGSSSSSSYMLFANGYIFHKSCVRASKTHWTCNQSGSKFKCRASASTHTKARVAENEIPQIIHLAPEEKHKHPRPSTIKYNNHK